MCSHFTEEEFRQYPFLKYMTPLKEAMYEFVDIDLEQKRVSISGTRSNFVGKSPVERGHSGTINGIAMTAEVKEKMFCWK